MTNFQVYRKTLSFSLLMFLVDILVFAILGGSAVGGFFIADSTASSRAFIGLIIGLVIGIILAVLINIFITNRIKAAQISMMVKGVTEGNLPDRSFKQGFEEIKGRFASITGFYLVTRAIRAIVNQISRGINRLGTMVGGQVGNSVTSAIDSAVQTLLSYLCDCCLGWILYRKDISTAKAGCEGAVIFFKHGKTLIRNIGRIFGMGLLSLVLIGGGFFGISYLIFMQFPTMFDPIVKEIADFAARESADIHPALTNPTTFAIVLAAVIGLIIWGILHSVLIRPFVLVGVMRNYMAAGIQDMPTESDFAKLDSMSPRFRKMHNSI